MTRKEPTTQKLMAMAAEAHAHLKAERFAQARKAYEGLLAALKRSKRRSADPLWGLAEVSLHEGNLEGAVAYSQRSMRLDPLDPRLQEQSARIARRARLRLTGTDGAAPPSDERLTRLYELLGASGDADAACHLAMARVHARRGDADAARALLEALVVAEPSVPDVWWELATLARARGAEAQAADYAARGEACAAFGPKPPAGVTA